MSKPQTLTTPLGVARYPKLTKPDTKFDADGVYTVDLILSEEGAKPLCKVLDEAAAEFKRTAKADPKLSKKKNLDRFLENMRMPYDPEVNDEGGETGNLIFKFKAKAQGKMKDGTTFQRRLILSDSMGVPFKKPPEIGGGSKMRVAYQLNPYFTDGLGAGISLRLVGAQIVKLNSYNGFSFDACESDDGEEGYVDTDDTEATSTDSVADDFDADF